MVWYAYGGANAWRGEGGIVRVFGSVCVQGGICSAPHSARVSHCHCFARTYLVETQETEQ